MSVEITGRHIVITPALRSFTLEKLEKLHRYFDDIIETHVILSVEKRVHRCEITFHARSCRLEGHVKTSDLYSAIGLAVDKIVSQAKRHKEKIGVKGKKKASAARPARGSRTTRTVSARSEPAEERVDGVPRIIRARGSALKPMTPEDAALELDGEGREFLVFRSAGSQEMAVVFRRPDGNIGLIEG